MAVRASDFVLPDRVLQSEYDVYDIFPVYEYGDDGKPTEKLLGYNYEILLVRLRAEKVRVTIIGPEPIVERKEVLEEPIKVRFEGIKFRASLYKGKLYCKGTADNVSAASSNKGIKKETN